MKSGELARQAGVTPRALRHYRKIGLLPEPQRSSNGYCDYSLKDFTRVLRIKNLSSLGFSLEKIAFLMDDLDTRDEEAAAKHLDDLDKELVERIKHMEQQRQIIAVLRQEKAAADIHPSLAKGISFMIEAGFTSEQLKQERDIILLASHAFNEEQKEGMMDLWQLLSDKSLIEPYYRFNDAFYNLAADAVEAEKQALVQDVLDFFSKAFEGEEVIADAMEGSEAKSLFDAYLGESYNAAQQDVLSRIEKTFLKQYLT